MILILLVLNEFSKFQLKIMKQTKLSLLDQMLNLKLIQINYYLNWLFFMKPIFDVPHCCPINKQIIIITVIGTTHEWRLGAFNANPSTADKTLTAGVNAPSPTINQHLLTILLKN